jgi:hypothetical protein
MTSRAGSARSTNRSDIQVAKAVWKTLGGFGFLSGVTVIAAIASEKIGPDTFKLTNLDSWSVTLFAIPLLTFVVITITIAGRAYIRAVGATNSWAAKVPPILDGLERSTLRGLVSATVLAAFLFVPWYALGASVVKFFQGSYYYSRNASQGCDFPMSKFCETMGSGWEHFRPKYGLVSLTNTPYRYEGNKTYIPEIFPGCYLAMFVLGSAFGVRYTTSLFWQRGSVGRGRQVAQRKAGRR